MRFKSTAAVLITAMLLSANTVNAQAATKYKYNTYREGYNRISTITANEFRSLGFDKNFSESTGMLVKSRVTKWCAGLKVRANIDNANSGMIKMFSPNAINGCVAAAMQVYY
jgi:hypothetical protein